MAASGERKRCGRTILSFFEPSNPKTSKTNQSADEANSVSQPSTSATETQQQTETEKVCTSLSSVGDQSCNDASETQTTARYVRQFQDKWLQDFKWLHFDPQKNAMSCKLCVKHNKRNTMTGANMNFRTSTLTRHADSGDHEAAVLADSMISDFQKAVQNVQSEKERAAVSALKVVFWLAKEDIALNKYDSLLNLVQILGCPEVLNLKTGKNVTYSSDKSACEMLESLAAVIRNDLDNKLMRSPFISILCDESTDIGVKKKLVVYARILDPDTFMPSTKFLCNLEVHSATGKAIYEELTGVMKAKQLPVEKVFGLGTDGAKVMTGTGEGLTGYMLRKNPMMLNYHCIAHRLALVTLAQAVQNKQNPRKM